MQQQMIGGRNFPSRSLASTADLVVLAPWKAGIVEADDLVSFHTRLMFTFNTLFEIRRLAREANRVTVFSDPIERLEQIHSFRIRATQHGMLLAVTYDHQWDSYMTALHRDAGAFLDLLLINCADYVTTRQASRNEWANWVRARELPSDYFYAATVLTVPDMLAARPAPGPAGVPLPLSQPGGLGPIATAVQRAAATRAAHPDETHRQALRALAAMYRLTRLHGADIRLDYPLWEDARTLHAATHQLLLEWRRDTLPAAVAAGMAAELAWFDQKPPEADAGPGVRAEPIPQANVQRGLLGRFDAPDAPISHGALLLLRVTDQALARTALSSLPLASEAGEGPADGVFVTVALTVQGLTQLGIGNDRIAGLSEAFRQGAAARAGQVGDVRSFHPAYWQMPKRNRPAGSSGVVAAETVDVILVLRTSAGDCAVRNIDDPDHPLFAAVDRLQHVPGLDLMHVEGLGPAHPGRPGVDHLGFQDGISQPDRAAAAGTVWSDLVPEAALLIGPESGADAMFHGGAYLALRHVRLHADRFERLVERAATVTGLRSHEVRSLLVGREPDGTPLVPHSGPNDFDYGSDPLGAKCPLQSHVRRSNPRGETVPRIMRRGMSFGPPAESDSREPRGSMFMASCADLAQQYEVLLRWLNGDNSSRLPSWACCPLTGPLDEDGGRILVPGIAGRLSAIRLDREEPVAELDWSMYALVPPISLVRALADAPAPSAGQNGMPELAETGRTILAQFDRIADADAADAAWRAALRDPAADRSDAVRALWAAVNAAPECPGVRRTPVGVLVGRRDLVLDVLRDDGRHYSVAGAGERIAQSIGGFHLGWDANSDDYRREAPAINGAIRQVTEREAFAEARAALGAVIDAIQRTAGGERVSVDIVVDLLERSVARSFPVWFDLPDGRHVAAGGQDWRGIGLGKPRFPGDYWSASRHAFIPLASRETGRLAAIEGPALVNATCGFLAAFGRENLKGLVSRAMAFDRCAFATDRDLARALTGAMLGAVATTLGNGARIIDAWARSGQLQRLAFDWRAIEQADHDAARGLFGKQLEAALRHRPVPDQLWRVVNSDGLTLGGLALERGDILILGMQAVAAEEAAVRDDAFIPFGMAGEGKEPPHGCPGRDMALGLMLGWVAALMERADIRPSAAPGVLELSPIG